MLLISWPMAFSRTKADWVCLIRSPLPRILSPPPSWIETYFPPIMPLLIIAAIASLSIWTPRLISIATFAGFEPADVVEVGVQDVAGRGQEGDPSEPEGQDGEGDDAQQGKHSDYELRCATCVHGQELIRLSTSSPAALPARKRLKSWSSDAITSSTVPTSCILPRCMKATRSEIENTSGTSWLTTMAVRSNSCCVLRTS